MATWLMGSRVTALILFLLFALPLVAFASAGLKLGSIKGTPNAIDVGQVSNITVVVSSGEPPYTFTWYEKTPLSPNYTLVGTMPTHYFWFAPNSNNQTGNYQFSVKVSESNGLAVNSSVTSILLNAKMVAPKVTTSVTRFDQGQTLFINTTAPTTGTPPYKYAWSSAFNAGKFVPTSNCAVSSGVNIPAGAPISCAFTTNSLTALGMYQYRITFTDSAARPVTLASASSLAATLKPAFANLEFSTNTTNVSVGNGIKLSASVTGGSSTYTYLYTIANESSGKIVATKAYTTSATSNTYVYKAATTGQFLANVIVTDSATLKQNLDSQLLGYTAYSLSNITDPDHPLMLQNLPANTTTIWNLTYCNINETNYALDMFISNQIITNNLTRPVIVYIHGGGWTMGNDDNGSQINDISSYVSNGFIAASITYALAPGQPMPDAIIDSKCAIRFLRANAATYHINPNEIGVYGDSAGGNLVALLGVVNSTAQKWDSYGQWTNVSSSVQAVVDEFGPTNITKTTFPLAWPLAFDSSPAIAYNSSPIYFVNSNAPPFLIQQGVLDTTVPENQSISFYNALIAKGDAATLTLVQNSGHEFTPEGPGPLNPTLSQLMNQRMQFFQQALNYTQG